jgi:hypothetical protein
MVDDLVGTRDGAVGRSIAGGGEKWYIEFRVPGVGFRYRGSPGFVLKVRGVEVCRSWGGGHVQREVQGGKWRRERCGAARHHGSRAGRRWRSASVGGGGRGREEVGEKDD